MNSSGLTCDFVISEQASSSRVELGLEERARMDRSSEAGVEHEGLRGSSLLPESTRKT